MQTNALSAFGRMNYYTHLLSYPILVGGYFFAYVPYTKKQE